MSGIKDWCEEVFVVDAVDKDALEEISRNDFDAAIIALGSSFSNIMIVTVYLRDLGIPFIVGRAGNDLQGQILTRIGCNKVIMPEEMVGRNLADDLILGETKRMEIDSKNLITEIFAPPIWWDEKIGNISLEKNIIICAVLRDKDDKKRSRIIVPAAEIDFVIREGDKVLLLGDKKTLYNLSKIE